ncbi:ribose-phosphate diphosphokinase [Candidatus Altiarchaeota archaeon]
MIVFSGQNSKELAAKIVRGGFAEGKVERKTFPDGELYLRVATNVKGKECVVVASTTSNDDLVELLLLLDALNDQGAERIIAVVPYLAYARQDKAFLEGEALSAKTVVKLVSGLCDEILTFNCHFLDKEGKEKYQSVEVNNLDAFPILAKHFQEELKDPILIAPDKGSLEYAKTAAERMGCDFDNLSKTRVSSEEVEYEQKDLDVNGRDVLILDDIISTGGTIIRASEFIRKQSPSSINVGCVHGVFARGTEGLKKAVDSLVCTDTIQRPESKVSVSDQIIEELKK